PKMGFGVPLQHWLRGPLREWAEDLLSINRLKEQGYFRHEPIIKKLNDYLYKGKTYDNHLWVILMFQSWYYWYNQK
ncbi:MAG: asparagine synthase C-terminal domain-containing protein, partial [Thermaceae bacterium]|nr:asparagine synthase C-terminal domain-containing protein [Thermaceae bacterium]